MGSAALFSGQFQQGGIMDLGALIGVILVLAILGLCLHLLFTYVPMEPPIKTLIIIVVVLVVILYLLSLVGIVPRFR
jgi:FtsH-binding integral membrane protein